MQPVSVKCPDCCMRIWSKIVSLFALVAVAGITLRLSAAVGCICPLQWNASPSSGIAGYAVYYGVSGSSVTNRIDVGMSLTCTVTGLAPATSYFFYVVVYDAYGDESPPSNVVTLTTPPISSLQISQQTNGFVNVQFLVTPGTACEVEYTPTLSPPAWTVLTNAVGNGNGLVSITEPMNGPQGFYRAMVPAEMAPQLSLTVGSSTRLQWNSSPTPGTTGYAVYYGISGSSVTNIIQTGSTLSATILNLLPSQTYFFYVVSYNSSGAVSPPSNIALYTAPPMTPLQISKTNGAVNIQFRVTPGTPCQVQYTTVINPPAWIILTNVVADTNGMVNVTDPMIGPQRFYRGAIGSGILPTLQASLPEPAIGYSLQWAPSLDLGILGYVVNYAVAGSSVTNQINVGQALSTTITGLLPSTTYSFSIFTLNVLGLQAIPLNQVLYTTPPISPLEIGPAGNGAVLEFRVSPGAACHVEYTTSLSRPAWTVLTSAVADTNGLVKVSDPGSPSGSRFYRAAVP